MKPMTKFWRWMCIAVCLFTLHPASLVRAIYDPSATTTKPPIRRESILPWYLDGSNSHPPDDGARSAKWSSPSGADDFGDSQQSVEPSGGTWGNWRKVDGSEIEQRSEIEAAFGQDVARYPPAIGGDDRAWVNEPYEKTEGGYDASPEKFDDNANLAANRKNPGTNFKNKSPAESPNLYEGVPVDSKKPRQERILVPIHSSRTSNVAKYDAGTGVQCPSPQATGQFVYPPDCKFFVNCHQGRAFVQPCAPGTLFSPDTLECDFPHKVKCYGGEIADFPSADYTEGNGRREPLTSRPRGQHQYGGQRADTGNELRCPPQQSGYFPHPSDCTKFIQCANGGTFVKDCGPGTVFNPTISVCDWPYNVKGCEDAFKKNDEPSTILTPPELRPHENYQTNPSSSWKPMTNPPPAAKKFECPPGHAGLLPHPDTCKKFLSCANGITYVMDCGPGTAFNPAISVCDWPYNVPGCSEERTTQPPRPTERPAYQPHQPDWNHQTPGNRIQGRPVGHDQTGSPTQQQGTRVVNGRQDWPNRYENPGESQTDHQWQPEYPGSSTAGRGPNGQVGHPPSDDSQTPLDPMRPFQPIPTDRNTDRPAHRYPPGNRQPRPMDPMRPFQPIPTDRNTGGANGQVSPKQYEPHQHNHPHTHGSGPGPWDQPGRGYSSDSDEDGISQVPSSPDNNPDKWPHHHVHNSPGPWDHPESNQHNHPHNHAGPGPWDQPGPGYPSDSDEEGITQVTSSPNGNPDRWPHHHVHNGPGPWDRPPPNREQTRGTDTSNEPSMPNYNPNKWGHHHVHNGPGPWDQPGHKHERPDEEVDSQVSSPPDGKPNAWQPENHYHQGGHHNYEPDHGGENWKWENRETTAQPTGDRGGYGRTNPNFPGQHGENGNTNAGWQATWNRGSGAGSDDRMIPSQPDPAGEQPGVLDPNVWRGHGWRPTAGQQGQIPTAPPKPEWNQGGNKSPQDRKLDDWSSKTNVIHHGDSRNEQDTKMNDWKSKTNIFNVQQGNKRQGVKTSQVGQKPGPPGIYVNSNGIKGHYITKELEINQGYANTRHHGQDKKDSPPTTLDKNNNNNNFHTTPRPIGWRPKNVTYLSVYEPIRTKPNGRWIPTNHKPLNNSGVQSKPVINAKPSYEKYPNKPENTDPILPEEKPDYHASEEETNRRGPRTRPGIELPTVAIEAVRPRERNNPGAGKDNETVKFEDAVQPDPNKYEVDVLDDKERWKPKLTFENKTKKAKNDSVVMSINRKKNFDVEILDVRLAPLDEDEPPFPEYYIAPVHPMGATPKPTIMAPGTGQILRLRGGSSPRDGYLEAQGVHPGWGVVCDARNAWSLNEAHVVCRQLGYTRGAEMAWQGRSQWDDNEIPWIAATEVECKGNETRFQTCKFVHDEECNIKRDAVGIRCMSNRVAHCAKDEVAHNGQCYHLADPKSGLNHAEALEYCAARKSQLVDITTQAENNFLSEWLIQAHPEVASIMTSGVGFTTFNRTIWMWEDSARAKFQFSKWWPGWMRDRKLPPWAGSRPVCIVMKKEFPCLVRPESNCPTDYFFWDIEDCASSMKGHSYVCERPYNDISCVYGKGQQYSGVANVSASGKECLPWSHQSLAHSVRVNVLNQEVREKLMTHNYCRNPNPMKESRPWCFIGLRGEREYCDIPSCGKIGTQKSIAGGQCKPKHFECMPGECIPAPWVCDGEEDCTNGLDERSCSSYLGFFKKTKHHKLEGHDVEKWLNTPVKTCALRCKEADFACSSFSHKSEGNVCFLSDTNVGASGDLRYDGGFDYYEMIDRSINCEDMFVCGNEKCVNRTQVCDGKNDCGDRTDENICAIEKLDYGIRLAGSNDSHEGRVEVKVFGHWGQVCDDGFGMIDANVVCKELGFGLGALEVRPGGYYGNLDPPERFMVDQLKCRGNESSLRECDFDGWGVHNCLPEEAVGVVCKSAVNTCQLGHWKCDVSPTCIPTALICDEVVDCPDGSDESSAHCAAPFELRLANGSSPREGRVEVRHHGIWGTVCDDDFSQAAAKVICRSLGYGGKAIPKKNGFFGPGDGPIWLDEVFCHGSELQLYKCEHDHWGRSNCDHDEDAGVICSEGSLDDSELGTDSTTTMDVNINDLLPSDCGRRAEDFGNVEDEIFQRVVRGSIAPRGSYPWQASIRVRGHSRSSHWCGAVVLSPRHVLTAAHCLEGYNKGTYFIRAGDYNSEIKEGTEVEANIEDYYVHEDFRKGQRMNNDIALVLLKGRGLPLGEHVMPICLPPANVEYSPGLNCTISGFGSIETGKSVQSLNLRYGWIPLIDQSTCRADYVYGEGRISDGMFCAGFLNEGVDACDGDSGGPLACLRNGAYTLYGVTSWGHHCGEANKPGVYVRIAHYRDWIERKIRESFFGR